MNGETTLTVLGVCCGPMAGDTFGASLTHISANCAKEGGRLSERSAGEIRGKIAENVRRLDFKHQLRQRLDTTVWVCLLMSATQRIRKI